MRFVSLVSFVFYALLSLMVLIPINLKADTLCSEIFMRQIPVLAPRPDFLNTISPNDPSWAMESVRYVVEPQSQGFQAYFKHTVAVFKQFDILFRQGEVSKNLKEVLRSLHILLVRGETSSGETSGREASPAGASKGGTSKTSNSIYSGTSRSSKSREERIFGNAGTYAHEYPPHLAIGDVVLDLYRPGPQIPANMWTGPGYDMAPPPNLPGPFPSQEGESWHLWFPEVAEKAQAQGREPHSVMPRNFKKEGGIKHQYPSFIHQPIYLERMSEIMAQIENALLRSQTKAPVREALLLMADYYQVGINAHLFEGVNNSLLMVQIDYFLHFMGLQGIPDTILDYLALYKVPADFRAIFIDQVKQRNPGL